VGRGPKNNQLEFNGDPDHNLDRGSWIWITIWIKEFLKDSLFTIAIPIDSLE